MDDITTKFDQQDRRPTSALFSMVLKVWSPNSNVGIAWNVLEMCIFRPNQDLQSQKLSKSDPIISLEHLLKAILVQDKVWEKTSSIAEGKRILQETSLTGRVLSRILLDWLLENNNFVQAGMQVDLENNSNLIFVAPQQLAKPWEQASFYLCLTVMFHFS